MSRNAVRAVTLAASCSLVLAVAGCGGGGSKSAAETPEATTTETHAATTTEEQATTQSETTDVSDLASAEDCKQLAELGTKLTEAMGATGAGADTETTARFLTEFADRTPKEIRADFQLLAQTYAKIVKALEGIKTTPGQAPSAEALAKLQKIAAEIDQPAMTKAQAHITAWVTSNCKG